MTVVGQFHGLDKHLELARYDFPAGLQDAISKVCDGSHHVPGEEEGDEEKEV